MDAIKEDLRWKNQKLQFLGEMQSWNICPIYFDYIRCNDSGR